MSDSLKMVFSIPLYYDSPEKFSEKLKKKFENEIKEFYTQPEYPRKAEIFALLQVHFASRYPSLHKYNNILGYAELIVDGNDILIYYFLNGDNRKIYNKNLKYRSNRQGIYHATNHIFGGTFRELTNNQIKQAFESAFIEIERQCKEWKTYINLQHEREIIKYIDFINYFKENHFCN
jgi:hypothetical protein